MPDKTLTTGQTCGVTHIPLKTLQRYIHEFREFFSESAAKTSKGRRFSQGDVEKLLLIRRLYFERTAPDRIRAALMGEWSPPAKPVYDALDALNLVEDARKDKQLSRDYSQQAMASAQDVRFATQFIEKRFKEILEKEDSFQNQVPLLLFRIDQLESQIAQLQNQIKQLEPKRRGLLDFFS